jgi:hypothetical protein
LSREGQQFLEIFCKLKDFLFIHKTSFTMLKIAVKFGLILALGLTLFFLFMHFLNLSQNYNLRIINGVIHLSVIYFAIKAGTASGVISGENYVNSVFLGMLSGFIGVAIFAFFQMLFLIFDTAFMAQIKDAVGIGEYLNPYTASLIILVEGVAVSLIGSYIVARIIEMKMVRPAS